MRKMKDSGVEWIGEIPVTWNLVQLGSIFSEHKQKNKDMQSENLLSLSYGNIVRKDINTSDGLLPESFEGYNVIDNGDIVLRLTDLQNDQHSLRVGLCHEKGIVTSAYVTLRKRKSALNSKFFYYLIHSYDVRKGFYGMGAGVRQGLNYAGIKKITLVLPTDDEQDCVVAFLDEKMSKVDALIANVQSQIEKLKAYKQSVITEVVTKGLDPTVPMKDSGVEWIGKTPRHWSVSRVGRHATIILGKMLCSSQLTPEHTLEHYYCAANVHFEGVDRSVDKSMWFNNEEKKQYLVQSGDLLVVEGGAGAGGCAIVQSADEPIYIQNSIMILRQPTNFDVRYFRYLLESYVKRGYIDLVCNKATIPHFTKDKLSAVPYPIIPFHEQKLMADYLDDKCRQITQLIAIKQKKIDKLNEYKKSIIYEYVTGKKEVR